MVRRLLFLNLFYLCLFLAACKTAVPTPTATAVATAPTATATDTAVPPTPTRRPTLVPQSTATPETEPVSVAATPTDIPLTAALAGGLPANQVHPHWPVVLQFSQPMQPGGISAPLQFTPPVTGTFAWDESQTTLIFTPNAGLTPGGRYEMALSPRLTAVSGDTFSTRPTWSLNVLSRPSVSQNFEHYQSATNQSPVFNVAFTRNMDWQSVAAAFQTVPPLPVTLAWRQGSGVQTLAWPPGHTATPPQTAPGVSQLMVQIDGYLDIGASYRFMIADTAVDQYGLDLTEAVEWRYYLSRPYLRVDYAANDLDLRINYRLDLSRTLSLLTMNPPVEVEWRIEWQGDQTHIYPRQMPELAENTTYSFNFNGELLTADGRRVPSLDLYDNSFHTPSVVNDVTPRSSWYGWGGADPITDITITFKRPMDQASTEAAFTIQPAVAGSFSWAGNKLHFQPAIGRFDPYQTYHVALQTTALDSNGQPVFTHPYEWSFSTGELHTPADFGVGYKLQVVDANGRRAVQYRSAETRPVTVTFALYDLNQEQARQIFSSYQQHNYRYDVAALPLAATWVITTTPQGEPDENGYYLNPQELILPSDVPPGPYVLTLDSDAPGNEAYRDQLLLFLTHYALAVKKSGSQMTVWATDLHDAPAADLSVSVWDNEGREIANGRTDNNGFFQTALSPNVTPAYVLAAKGDDLIVTGFNHNWGTDRRFNPPPTAIGHITTDRPIYRPGHTVYFRAILRRNDDATVTPLPEGTAVTAYLRDARGNLVQSQTLTTNQFSTVNGQFLLAEGAMLGSYRVDISMPNGSASQPFLVEDYRKPDYEVTVTTDAERYLVGEPVSVTIDSAYFFGEPLANAAMQIYLFRKSSFWDREWRTFEAPMLGQTDGHGRYTFTFTPGAGFYTIEATVDDGSHQSVSGFRNIEVRDRAESLTLQTGNYVKEPGVAVTAQVEVKDIFGSPVANRVVTFRLRHYDPDIYDTVEVDTFTGVTDGNGRYTLTFTPAELGYYQLDATATDRLGNEMRASRQIFVFNPADNRNRWYGRSDALTIALNQDSYAPGETAQILIQSTFAGPALLTLERATIYRQQVIDLTPPLTIVDVPIEAADLPNIFVGVMAWKPVDTAVLGANSVPDSQLLFTETQLNISLAAKTLTVAITPNKSQYQPGEEVAVTLRVTNSQGDPVSAELSLAVVDEAIFSLSPDLTPPMLSTFYFPRPNQLGVFDPLRLSRRLIYYGEDGGGGGGGGGDEGTPASTGSQPRRDFQDTAVWFPTLQTDANGEVTVTFQMPDNLTSWRLTARAVTADTQVGESMLNITTWKPVIVRPILPRALTAGDEVELSAVIHNNSETSQMVNVQLSIDNSQLTIDHSSFHTITISPGASQVVGWSVTAVAAGSITLTVQAADESGVLDAVELPLTIRPLAIPTITAQIGQFQDSYTTDILWPEDALDISTVQIDLSRSIAGSMVNGLEYLTGYPYGCVEQTMSRALPNVVVARAFQQLGVSNPTLLVNLEPLVAAGVQRLYGLQHDDGGWGWWANDASHDYQTAWVIFGLATTKDAGYEVDQGVIDRGANWLITLLPQMDVRTRAFALYALAISGHDVLSVALPLAEQTAELDSFSRAALALALHEWGETAVAQQLVDELAATVTVENSAAYWPGVMDDGRYGQKTMASTTRNTALVLSAFAQIRPGHELEPAIARYLMNQRRVQGWGSTNETAFTILALTDHLVATQAREGTAVTPYTVRLNGAAVITGTLAPTALTAQVELPAAVMQPGANELTIEHEGLLYYAINSRVYQPQTGVEAAGEVQVSRVYLDGITGEEVTAQSGFGFAVAPNQLVKVQLTVTMPTDAAYVIVEDSLPGGLEALNENLGATTRWMALSKRSYWTWLGYNRKEVRGDRVSFFITDMAAGSHIFTYYARATHVGEFIAMPAEVYAMYDMSVWGRSASRPLVIGD